MYITHTRTHAHTHTHTHTHYRATPDGLEKRGWSLNVRVRDGEGAEWEDVDTSCGSCNFHHRSFATPWIERLEPYTGPPCKTP